MGKLLILRHILAAVVLVVSATTRADFRDEAANDLFFRPVIEHDANANANKPENEKSGPYLIPDQSKKLIAAPIVLKQDQNNKDQTIGVVATEMTPQPENALDILRNELQRIQAIEQEKHKKDGWYTSTNKRFVPESMTFFVAIGLVTFNSMWIKSHGDPLAMERHILSLKDPIAHVSFYAFMVANGFYIDFKTKSMDAATKARAMRRLSYQGMAVGSLASSIVADLGHSGKMCVDYWIKGHNDEQSVEACNQAWKHWTVRNKFQQYFPQIMAMWASQAVTEIMDSTSRKAFSKVTALETVKQMMSKKFLVDKAHKIVGADTLLTFAGGTWSMKTVRWVGKLTQFTMFIAVDHAMSPYTYRPINNVIRPLLFDVDALAINNYVAAANQVNWDDKRLPEASKEVCSARNPNCLERRLLEEIESFGSQMQQWRENLNSDAEMDLAGWMEMTKKLLNQLDYAYQFYNSFVTNMYETFNIGNRIQSGELQKSAAHNISLFPFRKLPLYGVGIGNYTTKSGPVEDLYLIATAELERKQKEHILQVVAQAEKALPSLEGNSLKKFKSILAKLKGQHVNEVGQGLADINQILGVNSLVDPANKKSLYSENFIEAVTLMRKLIGNPMPVMYPFAGFSQAYSANSAKIAVAAEADFSLWSVRQKYMFNKESDLMTYNIFCGNEKGSLEKLLVPGTSIDLISPQFQPPRLLKKSEQLDSYCSQWRKTRELMVFNENLYGQKIGGLSMYEFFVKNFKYEIIGDYSNKEKKASFDNWWKDNGRQSMDAEFKEFDQKFKKLTQLTYKNIFDEKTFTNWFVDRLNRSKYLKQSVKENLQFETNFYLQLITRTLDKTQIKPMKDKHSFLETISKNSTNENFTSVNGATVPVEIQNLMSLFNSYYSFIRNDQVNFDQYIAHSKKIDGAIKDVMVLAGLASKTKAPELIDFSVDEDTEQAKTPSASGNETSEDSYEILKVNPNFRQKIITSSIQGLRAVESEIRRFIRMKVALSQGLDIDTKEFMDDWNNTNPSQKGMSAPVKANPFGQRGGG